MIAIALGGRERCYANERIGITFIASSGSAMLVCVFVCVVRGMR